MKLHFSTSTIEHVVSSVGSTLGGAVGNTLEAGVDGYETYENIHNHNYVGALQTGIETLEHGGEAVLDGTSGDWF